MKMTHNEAIAASRAHYATAGLREVQAMTQRAYDDACADLFRQYRKIKEAELAKLENDDADGTET